MRRATSAMVALLMGVVALTGCSSGAAGAAGATGAEMASASTTPTAEGTNTTSAPSAASSTTSVTAAPNTAKGDDSGCLFTVAQVSNVLSGTWERRPESRGCTYISDRGAGFGITDVGPVDAAGLQEARDACVAGAEPMKAAGEGFVCLEQRSSGDLVVGNTVARGRLWVAVIVPRSSGIHEPELAAMLALMNAVPVN